MSTEREESEPLIESIRPTRRRSALAGWGDNAAPWSVPIALGLFAVALLVTFASVPRWQFAAAGVLILASAPAAHFAMRRGHAYALPAGVLALIAVGAGVAFFAAGGS